MRTVVAIFMGLFSGFLIYMLVGLMSIDVRGGGPSPGMVFITFVGGTVLSAWLLRRGARSVSKVAARGFLLGAAEWMVMILAGVVFSGRAVSATVAQSGGSDAATAGAALGGGIAAFVTGGVSLFMIVVCLAGFAIAHFIGREMRDTTSIPTKKCPDCAEMVQAEARKCKHCGATLVPEQTQPVWR
jgi:hypothetical protein